MIRKFTITIDKHRDWVKDDYYGIGSQVQFDNVEHSIDFVKGAIICALGSKLEHIPNDFRVQFDVVYET